MFDLVNNLILKIMDALLGWSLALPSDLVLVLVAALSAGVLVAARRFTTNQDLLRRCHQDKKRLKELTREAKKKKDRDAVRRHHAVKGMIVRKTVAAEGRPLLVAIVPIIFLATWCFQRLDFHPPKAGESIEIVATFPIAAAGEIVHMVPQEGLRAADGWVKETAVEESGELPRAAAVWTLNAAPNAQPYTLQVRHAGRTYEKELLVGRRTYAAPFELYDGDLQTLEVSMRRVKLFGVVPGIPAIFFPPWLVAYLLLVFPLVPAFKRFFKVY